jgi:hypothetical protein
LPKIIASTEEILSEYGIRSILTYNKPSYLIETEWMKIGTTANIVSDIIQIAANSLNTNDYHPSETYIKYYIIIFDTQYSIQAVWRNSIAQNYMHPNDIADVAPGSELWKQIEYLSQKINKRANIVRYNFIIRREKIGL